jgi:uncharacterized repeat protein (TIGR03803 family)
MSKLNWWKTLCTLSLLCAVTAIAAPAQTFTTLFNFDGTNGVAPEAALIQGTDGNLYGTTYEGGNNDSCVGEYPGCGTIFKITPGGSLTTLYSFCSKPECVDGANPMAGLVQGTDGNFYGTTFRGGGNGGGTVFEIASDGTRTRLHSFCQNNCADGEWPSAGLVQAADGNLYGTTSTGGANGDYGTVFKITPRGTLTTLYSFCSQSNCSDGEAPAAGLVQASDGNLYGTTEFGGTNGGGTIFKITLAGRLTSLCSFCSQTGCTDGDEPVDGLLYAVDGNFYGTTLMGGDGDYGTVFKLTPSGTLTTLYSFCSQGVESGCMDGALPYAALAQGTDGGTIFTITPGGTLTTLYGFCSQGGCTDGSEPYAGLVQRTNGEFYGTTEYGGGTYGDGGVFGLSAGLGPFVETEPAGGKVGAAIKILGTNLTGATSVTFNGTPATFTVEASSVVKATVPAGATRGTVQVVTPSGTLSSNVPFRVAP